MRWPADSKLLDPRNDERLLLSLGLVSTRPAMMGRAAARASNQKRAGFAQRPLDK